MIPGDLLAIVIPLTVFLASGLVTFWLAKWQNQTGLQWFGCIWALITIALLFGVGTLGTWDGLIYVAALIGINAPAGVGGLIGGLVGRFSRKESSL